MSIDTQQDEAAAPHSPSPAPRRRGGRLLVLAATALVAVVVVMLPASNSIFAAGTTAILAIIAVAVADWLLTQFSRALIVRLVLGCLIGAGVGFRFQLTDAVAFRRAFGCDPPAGVRGVAVDGHYLGGLPLGPPSDIWILIQFHADEDAFDRLISQRPFRRDDRDEGWWRDDPATVWRQLFSGFAEYGSAKWRDVELPKNVKSFRWNGGGSVVEGTTVLRDQDTGRTYVLYGFG